MKSKSILLLFMLLLTGLAPLFAQTDSLNNDKVFRPRLHFSPAAHWINDPNGMVYVNGVYHLYFQYHPYSSVWGPMHWGHATSKDLISWKEEPVALYPDSLGYIFSGSAVLDVNNTSGFGKNGKAPLVAIFTHHNSKTEKERIDFQTQSIAFSNDNGFTWTKYSGNPVIQNPGIADFRDPKVIWHAATKKWVMTLATKDCVTFYSSPDLKNWTKESTFGKTAGAHGGVWECPDLIEMELNGQQKWVLLVSINPGAPNGGSATQYFVGEFDGHQFISNQTDTRWIDYGPDNYAGVTWSNTGKQKLFMGWMSNWNYAQQLPTTLWRNAMTIARELRLVESGGELYVASKPVAALSNYEVKQNVLQNITVNKQTAVINKTGILHFPARFNIKSTAGESFAVRFYNTVTGEELKIGYDQPSDHYFIDRSRSGIINFYPGFAAKHTVPRISSNKQIELNLLLDACSVELFADAGLSVMTSLFYPTEKYTHAELLSPGKTNIEEFSYFTYKQK